MSKTKSVHVCVLGVSFVLLPLVLGSGYHLSIGIQILVNIAMAVSLRMILVSGQFHICHAAFMGIGAYSSALLVNNFPITFWQAFPIAVSCAALIGLIIGFITLRLKGLYFFLATFILGEVFRLGIGNGPRILGGYTGITTKPIGALGISCLFEIDFSSKTADYYLALVLVAIVALIAYRLDVTRYGSILKGLEQNETLLESLGINTAYYKLLSFTICCGIAGLMGSFWAHYFLVVSTEDFSIWPSIYFLIYNQVGGIRNIIGPIIGAILLTILHEVLRPAIQFEPIIFGAVLITTVYFLPNGLIGLGEPAVKYMQKLQGAGKKEVNGASGN